MAVNLSPIGGVAAQFLDNSGNPLTGGKIFTYAAGTTTPQATYTSAGGGTPHANPIILDAAGRVPSGEIWLTDGLQYKFVIKTSTDVQIGSYDNIIGINSNFVNYTNSQEIQTATAGQTAFTLTTMQYQPGTNSLSVFVDGVNQYGPGSSYAYQETSSTVVTFTTGLHVGAEVKFTTTAINASSYGDAEQISYTPPFTGSVSTNVEGKLAQTVSVKDFGAVGNGVADDTAAIQAALNSGTGAVYFPVGTYLVSAPLSVPTGTLVYGAGYKSKVFTATANNVFQLDSNTQIRSLRISGTYNAVAAFNAGNGVYIDAANNVEINNCYIDGHGACGVQILGASNGIRVTDNLFVDNIGGTGSTIAANNSDICLYSTLTAGAFAYIITGNLCLSDNSQAIYLSALSGNTEIICTNNICIVCSSTFVINTTPTWRRHGIVASYNGGNPSRTILSNNVIRNTNWSGVYLNAGSAVSGPIIIEANLISKTGIGNYPVSGSLSGGVLLVSLVADAVHVVNNTIEDHQDAATGAINIAAAYSATAQRRAVIRGNVIKASLGFGVRVAGFSTDIVISENYMFNSVKNDIYCVPGANTYDLGVWGIRSNRVIRADALYNPVFLDDAGNTMVFDVSENTLEGVDNTTNADVNAGIRTRNAVLLKSSIKNNYVKKFYRGLNHTSYIATGTRYFDEVGIDYNVFDSCAIGVGVSSTANTSVLPVQGNRFLNCTNDTGASSLGGVACVYVANRNQTLLSIEATTAPTIGTWVVGDRCYFTNVSSGGHLGAVCTAAGNPGTWKTYAPVS